MRCRRCLDFKSVPRLAPQAEARWESQLSVGLGWGACTVSREIPKKSWEGRKKSREVAPRQRGNSGPVVLFQTRRTCTHRRSEAARPVAHRPAGVDPLHQPHPTPRLVARRAKTSNARQHIHARHHRSTLSASRRRRYRVTLCTWNLHISCSVASWASEIFLLGISHFAPILSAAVRRCSCESKRIQNKRSADPFQHRRGARPIADGERACRSAH